MKGKRELSRLGMLVVVGAALGFDALATQAQSPIPTPIPVDPPVLFELERLFPENDGSGAGFGRAIAMDGDRAVVGAPHLQGNELGQAVVFRRSGGAWIEEQGLVSADRAAGDRLGDAVDVSGLTVVVTATMQTAGTMPEAGAVYVFVKVPFGWEQQAKLVAPDPGAGDYFGWSVAADGDRVLVGAYSHDDAGENAGAAYVFQRAGTLWTMEQELVASDAVPDDEFGWDVALAGNTAVVGTRRADPNGAVYVFEWDGSLWHETQRLETLQGIGRSVALDGSTLLTAGGYGHAYTFVRSGASWIEEAHLRATDGPAFEYGIDVDVSGDWAVIGAWDRQPWLDRGSAYLFERSPAGWKQRGKLQPTDGHPQFAFGAAVALEADNILVGDYVNYAHGAFAGMVYGYPVPSGRVSNTCESTLNSTGEPARIGSAGSSSLAAGDTELHAFECPPGAPAMLFYARYTAQLPFGDGYLCVSAQAPGIFRLQPPMLVNPSGRASYALDFAALPVGGEITAGSTWFFQYWFRDAAAGGAGFNLTHGYAITFEP